MTNDRPYDQLRQAAWRRKLTAVEEAELRGYLSAEPELQADWEAELVLSQALERLPDAPVPSNFTARVLRSAKRQSPEGGRRRLPLRDVWGGSFRWLPRAAFIAAFLAAGFFSYQHLQDSRREHLAESVVRVSEAASVPSPDALADFDAIQALDRTPPPDEELLKLRP
jgi:hypothetical protein